jgi:hypothetical protein
MKRLNRGDAERKICPPCPVWGDRFFQRRIDGRRSSVSEAFRAWTGFVKHPGIRSHEVE